MRRPEIQPSDQAWLQRLARRLAQPYGSADDLVQDTCVTALARPAPTGERRAWLRAIMRNLAWGEVRGSARRFHREERYARSAPTETGPDPLLEYGVDRARLGRSVSALPEPFRSTVVQRFMEGMSCAEIARAEGVPAGTVRWRQSRALELLRVELERPIERRPRRLLWLPAVTVECAVALGRRLARAGTTWPGLAAVAALLVLVLLSGPGGDAAPEATRGVAGRHEATSLASLGPVSSGSRAALGVLGPDAPAVSSPAPTLGDLDAVPAVIGASDGDREHGGESALEAWREAYERALFDCRIDGGVLRCARLAVDPRRAGGATCVVLDRSLAALARARRGDASLERGASDAFLAAAELANAALVSALGCAIVAVDPPERADRRLRGPSAPREPSCTSEEGDEGRPCATCTDEAGRTSTVCAPADCETALGPDGRACTTCTVDGAAVTECAGEQIACDSEVGAYGLVCSSCPAGSGAPAECLVAQCFQVEGCLECVDGLGRKARQCSAAPSRPQTAQAGSLSLDVLQQTSVRWGDPGGATAAVEYAGLATCSVGDCLECRYADGGVASNCPYHGDLDDDLRAARPPGLPAPGRCVTEQRAPGIECTTCSREDLSASVLCRLPPATWCDVIEDGCASCLLVSGEMVRVCSH